MIPGTKVRITRRDSPLYGKIGIVQGLGHRQIIEEYIVMFDKQISDHYPYLATLLFPWDIEAVSRYEKEPTQPIEDNADSNPRSPFKTKRR